MIPDVGDYALNFTLPSTRGPITLAEELMEGCVLLVFYPRDNGLVCTRQLCNYRDQLSQFEALNVRLIAINHDPMEAHEAFDAKHGFSFPLASDVDRKVCNAYGVLGDLFKARRGLVLVGEDGRIWWRHAEIALFRRTADELVDVISELQSHA